MNCSWELKQLSAKTLIRILCEQAINRAKIKSFWKTLKDIIYDLKINLNFQAFPNLQILFVRTQSKLDTHKNLLELDCENTTNSDNLQEEMEKLTIGYARVSSREQAEDTNALNQQIARLESAGAKHILTDIEQGKKDDRTQYQELIRLVEARKVEKVFITRIDRITRSLPTLRKIIDIFQKYDVHLVILDQNLDLSTPQGKLMLNMLGVLAEWEVDLLSERIKRGKEHQRNQSWANGSCPWGFVVIDHQYYLDLTHYLCLLTDRPENYLDFYKDEIDFETIQNLPHRTIAEIARDCIDIFFQERGITPGLKKIFEKYGVSNTKAKTNGTDKVFHWTKRGFSLWLQNPILEGHTCYGRDQRTADGKRKIKPREEWQIIYNTHPEQRLLKNGESEEILRIITANTQICSGAFGTKNHKDECRPYAYQIGLIYCAECSSRCISKGVYTTKKQYGYYACRHSGIGCNNSKNVKYVDIEAALIAALTEKSQNLNQSNENKNEIVPFKTERLQQLEAQLAFLEQFPGFNPDAEKFKTELKRQIEEETNFFTSKKLEDKTVEEIISAGNNLGIWQTFDSKDKIDVYRRLLRRIFIGDGKVKSIIFQDASCVKMEN
jgi:site-specific DNA recombinase